MNERKNVGRPELQPYIVSVREVSQQWPSSDRAALREARDRHDLGEVTMCQGRAGHLIIQYAIPTQKTARRLPYFNREELKC